MMFKITFLGKMTEKCFVLKRNIERMEHITFNVSFFVYSNVCFLDL